MSDFETIETFYDYVSANLAKQRLQEHGINCYLADEQTVTMQWILNNAIGGIKLRVQREEKEFALKILNEKTQELETDHRIEIKDETEFICPNCRSNNTRAEKVFSSVGWAWLILGVPIQIGRYKTCRCFYCGHHWAI